MLPRYLEFINQPADQEYFTKFTAIFSRDESGNAVAVKLTPTKSLESIDEGYVLYCDKIRIGETIDIAIQRTLKEEFGLDLIDYYVPVFLLDVEKNKNGTPVTRFPIVSYVSYGHITKSTLVGCAVSWIDRYTYEYDSYEALGWLERNENSVAFDHEEHAVNREELIDFVKELYAAGAVDITLNDSNEQFYESSEPGYIFIPNYFEIRLPKHLDSREKISAICEKGIGGGIKNPIDTSAQNTTVKYFFN